MEGFDKFYNKALRFLSYRPRSEKETKDYLKRNVRDSGHGLASAEASAKESQNDEKESIIEKVIQKLKEQKFVNDEEFVKWWIEQRTTFKPRSLRLIELELRQKGIGNDLIEEAIYDLRIKNYDLERAKALVEKRLERLKDLSKEEVYQKLGSYLARRGFDWETIKKSIDPESIGVDEIL